MKGHKILTVSLLLFLLAVSTPFFANISSSQVSGTTPPLNITFVVPPNSLNDLTIVSGTSGYYVTRLEYQTMFPQYFGNGSLVPPTVPGEGDAIVTSESHNVNYTQWVFRVNTDLRWSNGQNLTAQDIVATYGPNFGLIPQYDIWGLGPEVSSEQAFNNSVAIYNLNTPDAHFPDKMTGQVNFDIFPASFVNNGGANSSNFGTDVGAGPFYVSNYTQGSFQMVMLRNSYFKPQPHIGQLDVNFVESLSQTAEYLLSGTSDLAQVEPSNAASILKDSNLGLFDGKGSGGISTIEYNDSVYPYNMTAFRQALAFSINYTQYVQQALNGYGISGGAGEGLASPSATAYYNPSQAQYSFNQTEALNLLHTAGFSGGGSSSNPIKYPNGTAVSLTIWGDTDNTPDTIGAGVIQKDLSNLGFNVNLQTSTAANIASDYAGNVGDIQSQMIVFTNTFAAGAIPTLNVEPAYLSYWLPTVSHPYWEYPPSANNEYENNYTAWTSTDNATLDHQYMFNIQALNAQYLPTLVLAYPDDLWAYNKASWTGWPSNAPNSFIDVSSPQMLNWLMLENLQYTGGATTSATSSGASATSSSGSGATITTSSSRSSSTVGSTGSVALNYGAIAVAAVIIVTSVAATLFMRREKTRRRSET